MSEVHGKNVPWLPQLLPCQWVLALVPVLNTFVHGALHIEPFNFFFNFKHIGEIKQLIINPKTLKYLTLFF